MKSRFFYVLAGILGILLFSTKAVFVKLAYQYSVDPTTLLVLRMSFALPFYLGAIVLQKDSTKGISRAQATYIFLFGFVGYYLASYLDFQGLKYIKASIERLVLFIYPSLVLFISFLFLKKKIEVVQVIAIAISYLGIVLVFLPEIEGSAGENAALGGFLVFLSGLAYAIYIAGSGWIIPKIGASRFTSLCMTVSCGLIFLHFAIENGDFTILVNLPTQVYLYGFLMGTISTVIPSYLISYSIKGIGSNQFAVFAGLGPLSTLTLAYIFLEERLAMLQIFGGIIIVSGILFAEKRKRQQQPN